MIPDQVVVITGPIGSGKSYVAGLFREKGWQVKDADLVGHDLLKNQDLISEIRKRWPRAVSNSVVDRIRLAELVFAEASELADLESLTHPLIQRRITEWIESTVGGRAVEVSVLSAIISEWGLRIVVDAPQRLREARLLARGMTLDDIRSRMKLQPERHEWLEAADFAINSELDGASAALLLIDYFESD
jgi:dephospho-CoA kinase